MKHLKKIYFLLGMAVMMPLSTAFSAPKDTIRNDKEKAFLQDNPVAAQLDSLATLKFFTNTTFITDISKLNKYHFPADSVPVYPDSVYRARIKEMSASTPFEFIYNDQVRAFIDLYTVKRRKLMGRMLGLAQIYFPLFEEQLEINDVPLELKYLPIIESALNPIARSRAGASGLWQFMLGTGKLYDLGVTSYVDDRFDPYKSTVAASRHLKDLYNIYHDWALVLAAYNAGAGSVNRAIRLSGLDSNAIVSYWRIKDFLPRETQNYVPAFIAVCYAMTYATEHNIYPVAPSVTHCDIDTVFIREQVTFNQIASFLCLPIETIQFLNPAYKKGVIPATPEKPYVVRLPRSYMADFINNEKAISEYRSKEELAVLNAKTAAAQPKPKTVQKTGGTVKAENKTTPENKTTAENKSSDGNKTQAENKTQSGTPSKYVYHTVQRGDSLWSIASKYPGVSIDDIKKLNNLNNRSVIQPGQKLKIMPKG